MKGYSTLTSGPYAVTSAKYTSQLLVKSNMDAHLRMIRRAKPTIDNKIPKTRQTSVKLRDQLKRDMIKNGRPPPRRITESDDYEHEEFVETYRSTKVTSPVLGTRRPASASMARPQSPTMPRPGSAQGRYNGTATQATQTPRYTAGDVLDDHKHVFTESRPFTPRTIKSKSKSKLSDFKYYNPPPKRSDKNGHTGRNGQTGQNGEISRDKKMTVAANHTMTFEPLRTRDLSQRTATDVPKLNITQDEDHMKWIAKQAAQAELREGMDSSLPNGKMKVHLNETTKSLLRTKSLEREEEELKVLDFVNDVTNDVLDRGIYTNKSLQSVFDHHIDKNIDRLNLRKMNEALEKLRSDLGFSETNTEIKDDETASVASSKGSGLEKYKRNLDRTLREAQLDYSVKRKSIITDLSEEQHEQTITEERQTKDQQDPASEFLSKLPKVPNENADFHPPPLIHNDLPDSRPDGEDEVRSEASIPSIRSKASVRSDRSRTSGHSNRSKSFVPPAPAKRGSLTSPSMPKPDSIQEQPVPQKRDSVTSLKSRDNLVSDDRHSKRSDGASKRVSVSSIKSTSTLKADEEVTQIGSAIRERDLVGKDTTSEKNGIPEKTSTRNSVSSQHSIAKSENLKTQFADELAKREMENDSDAGSTAVEDDGLDSTMGSLASENVWMKNPANFTMTLKPGQLDMTVVKPRPRARRREDRRRKQEEDSRETGRDSADRNVPPVAKPRSSARSDVDRDSVFSDGSDDF